jgi:ERCC4-type nuclease
MHPRRDVVLSALLEGAVIERKTPNDLANCIGASRQRFEKELRRGRYVGRMIVVVEGTLADVCAASRGISHNAIVGTLAAWTLRFFPFVFAGSVQAAAEFTFRLLAAQVRDAERMAKAISLPGTLTAGKKPVAGILAQKRRLPRASRQGLEAMTNHPETQKKYANSKKPQTRKVCPTRGERDDSPSRVYASGI